MLLDSGIAEFFKIRTVGESMPIEEYSPLFTAWFGDLDFYYSPTFETDGRKDEEISRRIRIWQNRELTCGCAVKIGDEMYEIVKVYHGSDEIRAVSRTQAVQSGQAISDLSLKKVVGLYDPN